MYTIDIEFIYLIVSATTPYVLARQFNPGGSNDHKTEEPNNDNGFPVWAIVLIVCIVLIGIGVLIACCFLYKGVRNCGKRIFKRKRRDESITEQSTEFIQKEEDTRTRTRNQEVTAI